MHLAPKTGSSALKRFIRERFCNAVFFFLSHPPWGRGGGLCHHMIQSPVQGPRGPLRDFIGYPLELKGPEDPVTGESGSERLWLGLVAKQTAVAMVGANYTSIKGSVGMLPLRYLPGDFPLDTGLRAGVYTEGNCRGSIRDSEEVIQEREGSQRARSSEQLTFVSTCGSYLLRSHRDTAHLRYTESGTCIIWP